MANMRRKIKHVSLYLVWETGRGTNKIALALLHRKEVDLEY
jgi:hypothetical protein